MGEATYTIAADPASPRATRLRLRGRVGVADAAALHRAALELAAGGGDVTVDCAAAEYLDPTALQVVLSLGRELTGRGRRCDVTGVAGPLAVTFRLAGVGGGR
jgi:anti-anti-sigma regulatory factor